MKEGSPIGKTAFSRAASSSLKRPDHASARTLTLGSQSSVAAMAATSPAILELSISSDLMPPTSTAGGGGSVSCGKSLLRSKKLSGSSSVQGRL